MSVGELAVAIRRSRSIVSEPFGADVVEFCAEFSARLFKDPQARKSGELQSLAFFMRRGRLEDLRAHFQQLQNSTSILAPRGVAFHIPPANVSAILAYSWLMSVLTGNVNIIRMPSSPSHEHEILTRVYNEVAAEADESMRHNTFIVAYGHDEGITESLSSLADIRVIWGGNATVNRLRGVPLPPGAKELTFPDKYSVSLISAAHFSAVGDAARDRLAAAFFNDTFWFDQMACSSPRLLVWHGQPSVSQELSRDFLARLTAEIKRRTYRASLNVAMTKEAFSYASILDQGVTGYQRYSNELTVLTLDRLDSLTREHCGGGLLFQYFAADLGPLLAFMTRRDQTLSHFGYSGPELAEIARKLRRSGVDRIVPIGHALEFHPTWDGYDLLQEFSRRIYVQEVEQVATTV